MRRYRLNLYACSCLLLLLILKTSSIQAEYQPCIHIMGDSIAFGSAVSQVPGHGFPVIMTPGFSKVLSDYFISIGISNYLLLDAAIPQSSLIEREGYSYYRNSTEYQFIFEADCEYLVIFPWYNDLPKQHNPQSAQFFFEEYDLIIQALLANRSDRKIIILSYYHVPMTELGFQVYGLGISNPIIDMMNHDLFLLCQHYALNSLNIYCLNSDAALTPVHPYVLAELSSSDFYNNNYYPIDNTHWAWLEAFWLQVPHGRIIVDAVHLNTNGKVALAHLVANEIMRNVPETDTPH